MKPRGRSGESVLFLDLISILRSDMEAGGSSGGSVHNEAPMVVLIGVLQDEKLLHAGELLLEAADAAGGGVEGGLELRGLADGCVALEEGTEGHGRWTRRVAVVPAVVVGGGCGGGRDDAAAGVELVGEHGADDEAERHEGVLDGVKEELVGELVAVDGAAYLGRLLLRDLPAVSPNVEIHNLINDIVAIKTTLHGLSDDMKILRANR